MNNLSEKLDEQIKRLQARKQAVDARERSKQTAQKRKDDTRRKILIGSCMLQLVKDDPVAEKRLLAHLDRFLIEERDRKLFFNPNE